MKRKSVIAALVCLLAALVALYFFREEIKSEYDWINDVEPEAEAEEVEEEEAEPEYKPRNRRKKEPINEEPTAEAATEAAAAEIQ